MTLLDRIASGLAVATGAERVYPPSPFEVRHGMLVTKGPLELEPMIIEELRMPKEWANG